MSDCGGDDESCGKCGRGRGGRGYTIRGRACCRAGGECDDAIADAVAGFDDAFVFEEVERGAKCGVADLQRLAEGAFAGEPFGPGLFGDELSDLIGCPAAKGMLGDEGHRDKELT